MKFEDKINKFLVKKSNKDKIIVIYWPTASWKTWLSIDIAKKIKSEIISTDSRQIFKGLDIWTWKITDIEKDWIKHHMLDIISPEIEYSVWEFKVEAEKAIDSIYNKWKIPILCWGTWLYIDSLIFDFNIPKIPANEELRNKLEAERLEKWNEFIYNKLVEIDPEYAKELHPNNHRYVIRALEVKILSWKSKLEFREEKKLKYDTLFITPYTWDREKLYSTIDIRVKQMFDDWLVNEVRELLKKYKYTDFWMKTIWYKEVSNFLLDLWNEYSGKRKINLWEKAKLWIKLNLEETIELVCKNNRNYAKTQLTWFRKYEIFDK